MPAFIFVPFPDAKILKFVDDWALAKGHLVLQPTDGGGKPLRAVGETEKLYVVCHGSRTRPVVAGGGRHYTGTQFAKLLRRGWGLKDGHEDLRMFSCYSGLGTFKHPTPSKAQKEEIEFTYHRLAGGFGYHGLDTEMTEQPRAYERVMGVPFRDADYFQQAAGQRLPFAAYLASALKGSGCHAIVVTGYHGAVMMEYKQGKHVYQAPTGHKGERAQFHRTRWDGDGNAETWDGIAWM